MTMSEQKTTTGQFDVRREVVLHATPEEVWDAVATPEGNAAWLFPGPPLEGRLGATDGFGTTVTAWDPPHHFAVRTEGDGGWFNALEFVIEGREGGTATLRYAHSGIFVDDWDNQYDAVSQHTDFYLHTLGEYVRHFAGRTARFVGDVPGGIAGPPASAEPSAYARLREVLGLAGEVAEGDSISIELEGLDPLVGVVDYLRPNFIGIRTDDGLYRFFVRSSFGGPVGVVAHLFRDGVDVEATKRAWQDWLERVYA
jgi:uncharacterized protein YndB with AHSA1/START domain